MRIALAHSVSNSQMLNRGNHVASRLTERVMGLSDRHVEQQIRLALQLYPSSSPSLHHLPTRRIGTVMLEVCFLHQVGSFYVYAHGGKQ